MTQETEREAFEKWLTNNTRYMADFYPKERKYVDRFVCLLWECWQARARVGEGDVERREAIAGLHGCRLAARGEYCASCVIQATNCEYQGEEDRRSKPHDYALSAKPVEVGELTRIILEKTKQHGFNQGVGQHFIAQAILAKYNVTGK